MNISFARRMENFKPGVFNMLDQKKREMESQGRPIYNLSIGTPDFAPERHVIDAMVEAAKLADNYKYAIHDLPELVTAVQRWYRCRYDVELDKDEMMSIYGSQEGLTHIALTLCDPGDVVLVPNPGYPIFSMGPALCGAKLVTYDLLPEHHYLPDFGAIPPETARAAKMMVVSYPANPVSVSAPPAFYEKLVAFAKEYDIVVIHDNAYSEIIYDGRQGQSFLSFPGAKDVGVEYNSLSKTYNLTGARISFVLGNREVVSKFRTLRSQIDYGIFLPVQYAAVAALNGPQESVERNRLEYQARRDALCGGLRKIGWPVPDSEGSMFVWAPLPAGFTNSVEFCFTLLEKSGVVCTPGRAFGTLGEGYVRFALVEPVSRIQVLVQSVKNSHILHG